MKMYFLLLSCILFTAISLNAQEKKKVVKEKKIIIVERGEDGKMIKKEYKASDEELKDIEKMNLDSIISIVVKEVETEESTEKKVIKKGMTKDVEVELNSETNEKKVIVKIRDGDTEEVMEWIGEAGEEIPKEFEVEVDESWVDVEELPQPNVSLGVAITEQAKIDAVLENSAAYEAGLKMGDIIKKIDEQIIYSHRGLLEHLTSYKAGDKVIVSYLREGNMRTTELVLKARD